MNIKATYCGWSGNNNVGDDAIFMATKKLLKSFELTESSDTNVTVFGGGTTLPVALTPWGDYDPPSSRYKFALGVGVNHPGFHNERRGTFDLRWILGEQGYSSKSLLASVGALGTALDHFESMLGSPTNISDWYFTDKDFSRIDTYNFDHLGVRGPLSKAILSQYGIEADVVGDPALYLEPESYSYENTGKIAVCVRGKGTKWCKTDEYVQSILDVCRHYSNYEIIVLPFYPPDFERNRKIAASIPNAVYRNFVDDMDIQDLLNEIATCDALIGEKLHANVLAASCHVPFVSLEYKPKNRDFAASLDLEEMNIRLDRVNKEAIRTRLEKALNDETIKKTLRENVFLIRQRLETYASTIEKTVYDNSN